MRLYRLAVFELATSALSSSVAEFSLQVVLVSPSGMVETPRLQAKRDFEQWSADSASPSRNSYSDLADHEHLLFSFVQAIVLVREVVDFSRQSVKEPLALKARVVQLRTKGGNKQTDSNKSSGSMISPDGEEAFGNRLARIEENGRGRFAPNAV